MAQNSEQHAVTAPAASGRNYFVPPGYKLIKPPFAAGGFGTVSLAKHLDSGADRAVKMIIAKDDHDAIRARKEIDVLTFLNHPNIVRFIGTDVDTNIFYVIMEYCDGGDLNKYLRDQKRTPREVPANLMLLWFRQLALAIAVSWAASNIRLTECLITE